MEKDITKLMLTHALQKLKYVEFALTDLAETLENTEEVEMSGLTDIVNEVSGAYNILEIGIVNQKLHAIHEETNTATLVTAQAQKIEIDIDELDSDFISEIVGVPDIITLSKNIILIVGQNRWDKELPVNERITNMWNKLLKTDVTIRGDAIVVEYGKLDACKNCKDKDDCTYMDILREFQDYALV